MLRSPEDAPYLAVLQAVQAAHDSAIAKLTEASAQHSQTLAVNASILTAIAKTQGDHDAAIRAFDKQASQIQGSLTTIRWLVGVLIPFLTIGVNLTLFFINGGPRR